MKSDASVGSALAVPDYGRTSIRSPSAATNPPVCGVHLCLRLLVSRGHNHRRWM